MRDDRDMRYDREMRHARRERRADEEWMGRGEYGAAYEAPYRSGFHGFGMGYRGGSLRSRGSYEAGQLRSGLNPVDEFEFEWGGGYVGGRGYGGTNYDYQHGYQTGAPAAQTRPSGTQRRRGRPTSPATRGGYSWSEYEQPGAEPRGPARYGYGPYHERLLRRRRSDDDIRGDVEETLFYDTWIDADRIQIEVEDGVVTLKGTLPNFDEVRYATDDAWDVDGVRGVRTLLEVEETGRAGGRAGETEARGTAEPTGEAEEAEGGRRSGASARAGRREEEEQDAEKTESAESKRAARKDGKSGTARAEAKGGGSTARSRSAGKKEGTTSRKRRSTSSKQKSGQGED